MMECQQDIRVGLDWKPWGRSHASSLLNPDPMHACMQMNGCLIIGTWDGANIEIAEKTGVEEVGCSVEAQAALCLCLCLRSIFCAKSYNSSRELSVSVSETFGALKACLQLPQLPATSASPQPQSFCQHFAFSFFILRVERMTNVWRKSCWHNGDKGEISVRQGWGVWGACLAKE